MTHLVLCGACSKYVQSLDLAVTFLGLPDGLSGEFGIYTYKDVELAGWVGPCGPRPGACFEEYIENIRPACYDEHYLPGISGTPQIVIQ